MIEVVLMDIEGTTTSIDFVHQTLFPYARRHMATFLEEHREEQTVRTCLEEVGATLDEEGDPGPRDEHHLLQALLAWIDADRKHGALKRLQGMIWRYGYEHGDYTAHLYPDVKPAWQRWREAGKRLAIYSSGSVPAQKLLFGHTVEGDLSGMIDAWFDTTSGHKRESESYRRIAADLGCPPERVLFLSDVTAELDAAREVGMETIQLVRPGTIAGEDHPVAADFTAIDLGGDEKT